MLRHSTAPLLLGAALACTAAQPETTARDVPFHVVNVMPAFFTFWDTLAPRAGGDTAMLVRLFRETVVGPHADFYAKAAEGPSDRQIRTFLERVPADVDAMRAIDARLAPELARQARTFVDSFPDFRYDGTVYFYPSLYMRDGGVMGSNPFAAPALMFGVDVIAKTSGAHADVGAVMHHELFHLYHAQVHPWWKGGLRARQHGTLWQAMWAEGAASYAARRLDARRTDLDVLLHDETLAASEATQMPAMAAFILQHADDTSGELKANLLQGGRHVGSFPPRAAYVVGYRVAERVGAHRTLPALARLDGDELRAAVLSALQSMAKGA